MSENVYYFFNGGGIASFGTTRFKTTFGTNYIIWLIWNLETESKTVNISQLYFNLKKSAHISPTLPQLTLKWFHSHNYFFNSNDKWLFQFKTWCKTTFLGNITDSLENWIQSCLPFWLDSQIISIIREHLSKCYFNQKQSSSLSK